MFHDMNLVEISVISILTTIVSYVIGDLLILRMAGNVKATIADFGLSFILVLIISYLLVGYDLPLITLSLLSSFFITCCEPFLHGFIVNEIPPIRRHDNRTLNQLQTEVAEEMDVYDIKK
ncbi:DUF2512 family protein [Ornithinibacillus xuwenensis]|uniref:DUF2512 family protein n=1 Tax=Ornithinibacillus xuwenensis TaxID=3144668 RepID=A0ABU9XKE8_9BACI